MDQFSFYVVYLKILHAKLTLVRTFLISKSIKPRVAAENISPYFKMQFRCYISGSLRSVSFDTIQCSS